MTAIEVDSLTVRYPTARGKWVEAVKVVSLMVPVGEIVGLVGPYGAGKSSILKALMGFVKPAAGSCRTFGHQAGSRPNRYPVGYLADVSRYYPYLTPLETLMLFGELQGLSGKGLRTEAESLLLAVGVGPLMQQQNRTLCKGMGKKIGIAQSFLGSPKLAILDEWTGGLDLVERQELRSLLKDKRRNGTTLLVTSQEWSGVDELCDRIAVMHEGRFLEERSIHSLREELRVFTLTYSGAASMLGLSEYWREIESGLRTASFDTKAKLLTGIKRVADAGGRVVDVVSQEGSLEAHFIDMIKKAS